MQHYFFKTEYAEIQTKTYSQINIIKQKFSLIKCKT